MRPAVNFIGGNQEAGIVPCFGAGALLNGTSEDKLPVETWRQQFGRPFIALPHSAPSGWHFRMTAA